MIHSNIPHIEFKFSLEDTHQQFGKVSVENGQLDVPKEPLPPD